MDLPGQLLRGLIPIALAACTPGWEAALEADDPLQIAEAFVTSRDFREAALQRSLRDPIRGYGTLRLEHYTADWEQLPVRNPTGLSEQLPQTEAALIALGREAFYRYPLTISRQWLPILEGDPRTGIRAETLVQVDLGDEILPADTCASCHSVDLDAGLGLANPRLSLSLQGAWPLGTVDPTPDGLDNPTLVPDLRPIRHQAALHAAGTLDNSLPALAVRIDTLLITSLDEAHRAPRVIPAAIAAWMWSLADALPAPDLDHRGAAVFEQTCARCHALDGVGPPIDAAIVGTDPAATASSTRGTGQYRIPSLRGVGDRGWLLHDASFPSLEALLDPARAGSAVHPFGLQLDDVDRLDLLGFLSAL